MKLRAENVTLSGAPLPTNDELSKFIASEPGSKQGLVHNKFWF